MAMRLRGPAMRRILDDSTELVDSPSRRQSPRAETAPSRLPPRTVEALLTAALTAHKSGAIGELLAQRPRFVRWLEKTWLAPVLGTAGDAWPPRTSPPIRVARRPPRSRAPGRATSCETTARGAGAPPAIPRASRPCARPAPRAPAPPWRARTGGRRRGHGAPTAFWKANRRARGNRPVFVSSRGPGVSPPCVVVRTCVR